MLQIWREIGRRLDETEIRVDKLEKAGLIEWHDADGEKFWRRTMVGNELVVAKRLAGEEEEEGKTTPKRSKHAELTHSEEVALLMMARSNDEGVTADEVAKALQGTAPMAVLILILLREKNMATDSDEPDYGAGRKWVILRNGLEHLAERGLI